MTPARLRTIEELFHQALDCEPGQLPAFLDQQCAGDEGLRGKVEALLASHRHAERRIETSIAAVASNVVENGETGSLIGQTFGHYKILKRIGAGGMGEVYLASDLIVGRNAALKLLPAHFTSNTDRLKRFQQEARIVAGLNHPNILTVYEVGEARSRQYIASELVDGETLRQRLARGSIQLDDAVEIAIQIAGALAAAHCAGVVHRDVKPENTMLRPDGYVKVLDFGIAKLAESAFAEATADRQEPTTLVETNLGSLLGTVSYMSPEQARPGVRGIDKRTDIWSLGAVLYEMATGRTPFAGNTPAEVMAAILAKEPSPLTTYITKTPSELQQIISKALRKDPGERFQSANEMLEALKAVRHQLEFTAELESRGSGTARHPWLRWTRSPTAVVLALLLGALVLVFPFYWLRGPTTRSIPEKSIAVLPFENLSDDKEHTFFADGVQDDVLTKLAKVADLKVISRTSVMQYRGKQDLRMVGRALGVSHVLAGTVRRSNGQVHINAQLLDTRTDAHVWAEEYHRDLNEIFAIEAEVAQSIVTQLQATLSPREKNAIERPTTSDMTAFDLYTRARNLVLTRSLGGNAKAIFLQIADLLNQAVARDRSFFQAYCQLAQAHDSLYFFGFDHTSDRLALAEAAIQAASRLHPDAGETHLARAENLYEGHLDYDGALSELEPAGRSLPNDPRVFALKAYIERRQGRWEESIHNLERAVDLDPRNVPILQQAALTYLALRRYAQETSLLERVLTIEPNDVETKIARASVEFFWRANTLPLHQTIDSIRNSNPDAVSKIADYWLSCALAERDIAAATNALKAFGETPSFDYAVMLNHPLLEGVLARMTRDDEKARAAFTVARAEQEKAVHAQPNHGPVLCVLGLIDAGLGRKDEALREGRRAVELVPAEKDPINAAFMIKYLAMIAAWVGEKDLACDQLETAVARPSFLSYGELKLLPWWDPLRGDPRFEKIVASLAPK